MWMVAICLDDVGLSIDLEFVFSIVGFLPTSLYCYEHVVRQIEVAHSRAH